MAQPSLAFLEVDKIDIEEGFNIRTHMDEDALKDLEAQVSDAGVKQSVQVRSAEGDRYWLVAGHRRLIAARKGDLTTVLALISEMTRAEAILFQLTENIQRGDLNDVDAARGIRLAVVTSTRVPASVRHTLNLESGLNDGLALPFVLFFLVLAQPGGDAGAEAAKLAGQAVVGGLLGVALGALGGRLHPRLPGGGLTARYEGIYAIGFALVAFGLAEITWGNGLIATFVCGIAMAAVEGECPEGFVDFAESASTILQVVTFFVFGALIVTTGFHDSVPALVAFVAFAIIVARPAAVLISFLGTAISRAARIFMAWFGPKGVASMLFALLVLKSTVADRSLVFDIVLIVIVASIVVHGLTDTIGATWVGERVDRTEDRGVTDPPPTSP